MFIISRRERTVAALAIALAQQDRRRRLSVWDGVDEHVREESLFAAFGKWLTWTHCCKKDSQKAAAHLNFQVDDREKFGLRERLWVTVSPSSLGLRKVAPFALPNRGT